MADQIKKPSPTHDSSDSNHDKPTKKRSNLQLHDHETSDHSPPSKRPQKDQQPAKETKEEEEDDEVQDTATSSNPKKKEQQEDDDGDPEAVNLPDGDVLLAIILFHRRNGVYPFENSSTMRNFLAPWIRLGIGRPKQLVAKIEEVKNKYNGGDEDVAKHGNEEEFQMWMEINWGKKSSGGDDKGGCS